MPQQSSVGRHEIDFSWEDKVNVLTNHIIIKLYKECNPDKVLEIEKLVKEHLESK